MRVKKSENFKIAYDIYLNFTPEEKELFTAKIFNSQLKGISCGIRKELRSQRKQLLKNIQTQSLVAHQVKHLDAIPTEILEAALSQRKEKK